MDYPFHVVALYFLTLAVMLGSVVGLVVFLVMYRPFLPQRHGRGGAHLIVMSWALLALLVLEIVNALVPWPMTLGLVLDLLVVVGIFYAVWQRVGLLRHVRRTESAEQRQEREQA